MKKLINLIRSLSAKEKNQYVKFARQHLSSKEAKKVQLFQLIARQLRGQLKDYNAAAHKLFPEQSLPGIKTHLYNQILSSLSLYSGSTARSQASRMIDEVQLLMDRGLLKQALSRIEKARKLIETHHLHFQYLELSLLHRRIIRQFKTRDVIAMLEEEQQASRQRLEWINREFGLLQQYEAQFVESRKATLGQEKIAQLPRPPEDQEQIHSFEGRIYYHLLWRQYYRNSLRREKDPRIKEFIRQQTRAMLELFENNPQVKQENLPRYLLVLYMYLSASMQLQQFDEVEKKLQALREMSTRSFYEEAQKESTILLIETILYFHLGTFEKMTCMAQRAWKVLEKYKVFISFERLLAISYNLGVGLFLSGKPDEAWDAFNYCLQKQDYSELKEKVVGKDFGKYVQASAHLYRLIAVQALNEDESLTDLLKSLLATTQHFLKQNKIDNPVYWQLLTYLRHTVNKNAHQREELLKIQQSLVGKTAYQEYTHWVTRVLKDLG